MPVYARFSLRATLWMQRTARTSRCYSVLSERQPYDKVYAAVGDVLAKEKPAGWTLEAFKYDYVVWDKAGVTVILIKSTEQLIQFQQKLIDAIAAFTVETGTAGAFFTTPEEPNINQPTIEYVTHYVQLSEQEETRATRHGRRGPSGLSEEDGRRTVRCVHVLADGVVGLSARQFRNGAQETQGLGVETMKPRARVPEDASSHVKDHNERTRKRGRSSGEIKGSRHAEGRARRRSEYAR